MTGHHIDCVKEFAHDNNPIVCGCECHSSKESNDESKTQGTTKRPESTDKKPSVKGSKTAPIGGAKPTRTRKTSTNNKTRKQGE